MGKKIFNLKTDSKKFNTLNLYKKEQLVICAMVLCFALSGIGLPMIKQRLLPSDTDETMETPVKDHHETKSDANKDAKEDENTSPEADTDTETNTENSTPNTPHETANDVSGTSNSQPSESGNSTDTNSSNNTSGTDTSGKVWVPPVYETIHHEAVYETRQVYICSGFINENADVCNQVFNSLEEWGTHKSINGG